MAEDEAAHPAERLIDDLLGAFSSSRREAAQFLWANGAAKLRRSAGGTEHLERLLGNELFSPLIDSRGTERGPLERIGDSARQVLTVAALDGGRARFLVSLKRSNSAGDGERWLITGLEREW